uniref:Uncharacterized protein n=1 Tax=Glossina palpalis gambiensis TaxID=67801 RepID=A0A1B0B959_9MUSC
MAPPQRMRIANEKASKYVTMRGNVPKSSVIAQIYIYHGLYLMALWTILLPVCNCVNEFFPETLGGYRD